MTQLRWFATNLPIKFVIIDAISFQIKVWFMNFVLVNASVSANFIRSELANSKEMNIKVGNF